MYGCYWPSLGEANEYTTTASIIRSRLSLPKKDISKVSSQKVPIEIKETPYGFDMALQNSQNTL